MKICSTCKEEKPRSEFNKCSSKSDGLQTSCKPCKTRLARERYRHNPEVRDYHRRQYLDNRETRSKQSSKWKRSNRDRIVTYNNKRRAAERGGGQFTAEQWALVCEQYGNVCLACGTETKLTVDHVVPVVMGGPNTVENLQPLCLRCNSRKGTSIMDFREVELRNTWAV